MCGLYHYLSQYSEIEKLLQFFVTVVDTELLKRVDLVILCKENNTQTIIQQLETLVVVDSIHFIHESTCMKLTKSSNV